MQLLKIPAHSYDVNSIAFADLSSQLLYSGGDDGVINVWDTRTLSEPNAKPVGFLSGHVDGITFIDSRNDGRHLISNSKDQTIKLWDIRAFSSKTTQATCLNALHNMAWDYRWQEVPSLCNFLFILFCVGLCCLKFIKNASRKEGGGVGKNL